MEEKDMTKTHYPNLDALADAIANSAEYKSIISKAALSYAADIVRNTTIPTRGIDAEKLATEIENSICYSPPAVTTKPGYGQGYRDALNTVAAIVRDVAYEAEEPMMDDTPEQTVLGGLAGSEAAAPRCEPPKGTKSNTLHVVATRNCPDGTVMKWGVVKAWFQIGDSQPFTLEMARAFGWCYLRPLDLSAEPVTPEARAVLDAAIAYRNMFFVDDNPAYRVLPKIPEQLCLAVDAYSPHEPIDPVKAAIKRLKAGKHTEADIKTVIAALEARDAE
jgi:hypothetical protein